MPIARATLFGWGGVVAWCGLSAWFAVLSGAVVLFGQEGAAAAATLSLPQALAKEDAAHLAAPDPPEPANSTRKIEGGGEEQEADSPQEMSEGDLKVVLTYRTSDDETTKTDDAVDGDEAPDDKAEESDFRSGLTPAVTVSFAGKEVAKVEGFEIGLFTTPAIAQIAELDPGNPHPEVVVSFFTGGAHCCSDTYVVTSSKDGSEWKTIEVGEFDGDLLTATDIDHDGRYEFSMPDNAFLYAFGCYACSVAPLKILQVQDGKVVDVSTEPRYRPHHVSWLKRIIETAPENEETNPFLAGYVAQKIRLGEGKQAWELMLNYYDRNAEDGLEQCTVELDEQGECPGEMVKLSFPDALQAHLEETGYPVEK